ncbi:MAG: hypothetical protein CME62_17590 [Halobacteriovoraceae bacterium]|nr:hypothetical protein [Halobacteriovoraceae bacterium]|tara:strand:+ start:26007 stop:27386 length:1380 start_codon:yes stop_codon:yes gene_type:complete
MKNLLLGLVLLALIGLAYYSEEIYKKEKMSQEEYKKIQEISFFKDLAYKFNKVKTPNYILREKSPEAWTVENLNYPASFQMVQELRQIFQGIMTAGVIEKKSDEHFFQNTKLPFSLFVADKEYKFLLGDISQVSGRFYLQNLNTPEREIYICYDNSRFDIAYKEEQDLNIKKYLRFRNILQGQEDLFIERSLFARHEIKNIEKIVIDSKRNRSFIIDVLNNQTQPTAPEGISYLPIAQKLLQISGEMRVKKVIKSDQVVLSHLSSTLTFYHDKKTTQLKLYKALNNQYGFYVKFDNADAVFELDENAARLFFYTPQDFWKKKILSQKTLSGLNQLEFKLRYPGKDNQSYSFKVDDLKNFSVNAKSDKVSSIDNDKINLLFNILFNLTEFEQADYVLETKTPPQGECIDVEMLNNSYSVCLEGNKTLVYDSKHHLQHLFNYSSKQIGVSTWQGIFTLSSK